MRSPGRTSTIKIEDVAHVRFRVPDPAQMRSFPEDFGLEVSEDAGRLFSRGLGETPFLHVTELGDPGFAGVAFSVEDLEILAKAEGAHEIRQKPALPRATLEKVAKAELRALLAAE